MHIIVQRHLSMMLLTVFYWNDYFLVYVIPTQSYECLYARIEVIIVVDELVFPGTCSECKRSICNRFSLEELIEKTLTTCKRKTEQSLKREFIA
jgi:hypothetical protein